VAGAKRREVVGVVWTPERRRKEARRAAVKWKVEVVGMWEAKILEAAETAKRRVVT
jgi:hypothetical protein